MTYTAEYFTNWTNERIQNLRVLSPWEPKDRQAQWVRGAIKERTADGLRDMVVTAPKMRVCFSGCNWNRVVFAMNGAADQQAYQFEQWLYTVAEKVKSSIWADPGSFRTGAVSSARFTFDDDFIKPANDPALYPDELRCKLSTKRIKEGDVDIDVSDADLFTQDEDGSLSPILPANILAGSHIIPVIKLSYYRYGERFGIQLHILRGLVFPANDVRTKIDNSEYIMDYPMEV